MTASVFYGMPDGGSPVTEVIRMPTDIISGENGAEQRIPLRTQPIRVITFRAVEIDAPEAVMLQNAIDNAGDALIRIPFWPEWCPTTADIVATDTVIPVDLTERRFYEGGLLMLWHGEQWREVAEIDTIDLIGGTVTITAGVSRDYPEGTVVMPVVEGRLSNAVGITKVAGQASLIDQLTVECTADEVTV